MSRSGKKVVGGDVRDFVRLEAGEVAGQAPGVAGENGRLSPGTPEQSGKRTIVSLQGMMADQSQRSSDPNEIVDGFLPAAVTDSRLIAVPSSRNISISDTLQPDRAG